MALVLVRVDCRLIHGQIIEAWTPFTRADCLLVANDQVAEDFLQRSIMEMSVPPNLEVAVFKVDEAAERLAGGLWADKRVILLFANCTDALQFHRNCPVFNRLNIGNTDCSPGKKQVTCSVSLGEGDIECLKEISDTGVFIEARSVPQDQARPINEIKELCLLA